MADKSITPTLFSRHGIHGGPVTYATIRFPPPQATIDTDDVAADVKHHRYTSLKLQGRVVLSRGGWIESYPLPCASSESLGKGESSAGSYKVLAFHDESVISIDDDIGSDTVRGMLFPSSSPSLSYLNHFPSQTNRDSNKVSSTISVVAYGGRRLSFLSGGALWSSNANSYASNDAFKSIPIVTSCQEHKSYLQVSDWIHDVALLDLDWNNSTPTTEDCNEKTSEDDQQFLMALGMVNNNCEIWGFSSTFINDLAHCNRMAFEATRLQVVTCDVRCMTYSMTFRGWNADEEEEEQKVGTKSHLPTLIAASGTVFGEIIVWGIVNEKDSDESRMSSIVDEWLAHKMKRDGQTPRIRVLPAFRLKGHVGSVFSVKLGPSGELASTSDDRTVRLWALVPISACQAENKNTIMDAKNILESNATHQYTLFWTGWGHTARVWDVCFAASPKDDSLLLISAGEDGVARIWNPYTAEKECSQPLRGHRCESLWTVDTCEGIVITGGNDGSVKLWDLGSRVSYEGPKTFLVPQIKSPDTEIEMIETDDTAQQKKRKKTKKSKGQICGMEFFTYSIGDSSKCKLLVATREGSLFSLDLTLETCTAHNSWSTNVVSVVGGAVDVDPSTGACIAVHPCGNRVVIGTSDGLLISSSCILGANDSTVADQNLSFNATSHRPVQSISWIDNVTLLVLYARGTIISYSFETDVPKVMYLFKMETSGIPLSFAHDDQSQDLYVGDSRGNLAYFDLSSTPASPDESTSGSSCERSPNSVLARVHAKEHVTGVTVTSLAGAILSVGNDGCLVQSNKDANGQLHLVYSIAIPKVTGLRNIWSLRGCTIVGGYYGNDYVVSDILNGYEFLRVPTGGRQRRHELMFNTDNKHNIDVAVPISGMAVVCTADNSIDLHSQEISKTKGFHFSHNIGHTLHGETINRLCWIQSHDCTYLLSGSNDCTVKLSKFKDSKFVAVAVKELPPHESCVRGVCSSSHPKSSESSLVVTCGGKLSMEFYILNHKHCAGDDHINITFLCSYRTLGSASIDHRMNIVKAIPLTTSESILHMVVAGDSDGDLHVVVISEVALPRRTTIGKILRGNGRPILCLDLVPCQEHILLFVGNTAGEIVVRDLSSFAHVSSEDNTGNDSTTSSTVLFTVNAHSSGINDLSAAVLNQPMPSVTVCSIGDDQSLASYLFTFTEQNSDGVCSIELTHSHFVLMPSASASPLKAVKVINDCSSSCCRVYTTGQDEYITLWQLDLQSLAVKYISSSQLGTEGSCLDCIQTINSNCSEREMVAVGGEGIELQSIDLSVIKAARKLHAANFLLITAGAGFSADSGLETYECAPAEYKELCDPSKLMTDAHLFQRFWLDFLLKYSTTKPHTGYELLDHWCSGGLMPKLKRSDGNCSPWWIYTSNVDRHFSRFEGFEDRVCEIHGSANEYICSSRIGYSDGIPRFGIDWEKWNQRAPKINACKQPSVQITDYAVESSINNSNGTILKCDNCKLPLRPKVLMFNDTDENVLSSISVQRRLYQTWESMVEESILHEKSELVILELGCGLNVPAVRHESEEVLSDCAKIIESQEDTSKGSVCLIRINPKNPEVDRLGHHAESVSIQANAKKALEQIDLWLRHMVIG
jgi:NAD-dependent SIR2 family protein deacetylase